ncbi:hypothetical protein FQN54_003833 [Arachnomyces sp. PD_36]|nr:hypothetical protein FQN54_003833 [Arachnomyces sp. PD_36]
MPSRRPHNKSRKGCSQCKKRRIKCDEIRPQCSNCQDYKSRCLYPLPVVNYSVSTEHQANSQGPRAFISPVLSNIIPSFLPGDKQVRYQYHGPGDSGKLESWVSGYSSHCTVHELLHRYTCLVYNTLSTITSQRKVWQTDVVQLGFGHKFLLRIILTTSALHLAHLQSQDSRRYMLEATFYHTAALAEFRQILNTGPGYDRPQPIFLFTCFVALFAFGSREAEKTSKQKPDSRDIVDDFLTVQILHEVYLCCFYHGGIRSGKAILANYWRIKPKEHPIPRKSIRYRS